MYSQGMTQSQSYDPRGQEFGYPLSPQNLGFSPEPVVVEPDPVSQIPAEPQVFVMEDCVVMVLKPRELLRKKLAMIRSGPDDLQVFADFERVFTHFRLDDGGGKVNLLLS
jgi:hypothetical protein